MELTPLYAEVLEALTILNLRGIGKKKKKGMPVSPDEVAAKVTITKHTSRVRMALDDLSKLGVVVACNGEYVVANYS